METNNAWLESRQLRSLCKLIRRSLSEATRFHADEGSPLADKANGPISRKIRFECGSAKYSDKHNCWILRHRGATSFQKRRGSFDSLSCTGGPSQRASKSSLPPRHARRVAEVYRPNTALLQQDVAHYGGKKLEKNPLSPPIELLQKIFRTVELRSMFEQAHLSMTKDPPGPPQCSSRIGSGEIDFSPALFYFSSECSRSGKGEHCDFMLQSAIHLCSSLKQSCDDWIVEVDFVHDSRTQKYGTEIPDSIASFTSCCLAEERCPSLEDRKSLFPQVDEALKVQDEASDKDQGVQTFEAAGSQMAGEQSPPVLSTVSSVSSCLATDSSAQQQQQQPGQPSTARDDSLYQVWVSNRSREIDNSSGEVVTSKQYQAMSPSAVHCGMGSSRGDTSENMASKTREVQLAGAEYVSDDICNLTIGHTRKQGEFNRQFRRNMRAESKRRLISSELKFNGADLGLQDEAAQGMPPSCDEGYDHSVDSFGACSVLLPGNCFHQKIDNTIAGDDEDIEVAESCNLLTQSSEWVELSHLGHVSDYTGFQRRYDSFFPLKYSRSLVEMKQSVEETLHQNRFDDSEESDEEVQMEKKRLNEIISAYPQRTQKEKATKRRRAKPKEPIEKASSTLMLPVLYERDSKINIESRCSRGCSICSPTIHSGYCQTRKRPFREIEFDLLKTNQDDERGGTKARRSRSQQISAQRKTSLLMLNELRHKLMFIANYNEGIGAGKDGLESAASSSASPGGIGGSFHQSNKNGSGPAVTDLCSRENTLRAWSNLPQISYSTILEEFRNLQRKTKISCDGVSQTGLSSAVKACIISTMQKKDLPLVDEEVADEVKTYQRAIRSYNGKADQERIEKREHEEDRMLQIREFEYRSRGKKFTAEEIEISNFESRPVIFAPLSESDDGCKFGNECSICGNGKQQGNVGQASLIFHPSYSLVSDKCSEEDDDEVAQGNGYLESPFEDLKILQKRLEFVGQYNAGLIVTNSRRRR